MTSLSQTSRPGGRGHSADGGHPLVDLWRRTSACERLPELLGLLGELLPPLLDARDRVSVVFREPDDETLRIYRLLPPLEEIPAALPRVKLDGTPVGRVVREGVARVVGDVRRDRNITFGHASHDRIRSTLSVPIVQRGRVVGAMNIGSKTADACTEAMVPRLTDIAAIVGPALLAVEDGKAEARVAAETLDERTSGLVGRSESFQRLLTSARRAAQSGANVLITGETGVGKTALARAMHGWSRRAAGPFVSVHLGALSPTLIEAELFGHERGAFTGAAARRAGRFERASGGTLFIDELADTPLETQVKLLRVIQDGTFERVGGSGVLKTDVRLIAATHRDLDHAVAQGAFREDLLYRINVVPLHVPPLRERAGDAELLAQTTLDRLSAEQGRPMSLSEDARRRIREHSWPGNIRELESVLLRAAALEATDELQLHSLGATSQASAFPSSPSEQDWLTLHEHQGRYIERVLAYTQGVIEGPRGAAQVLGLRPSTLRSQMKRLGIDAASSRKKGHES